MTTDAPTDSTRPELTRDVHLDVDVDEAWGLVATSDGWSRWLVDAADVEVRPGGTGVVEDGGVQRAVRVERVDHGRRVEFTWDDGEDGTASVVIEVVGSPGGGSRVRIAERLAVHASNGTVARAAFAWEVRSCLLWSCLLGLVRA